MASVPAVLRATSGIGLVALALGLLAQFLLVSLGDDALPLLAAHFCDLRLSSAAVEALEMRIDSLADDGGAAAWQAWNLSR